ncbi:hypothetical protein QEZ40_000484 [Streptomyces katrae]|uniref:Lipoprotein n=1 Tax=Streptomyces katrae TaxID=68223 RepID=A0ABT7GRB9_9ACTN|nr:hypothetical protein [Streptomyces katrae]MDK9496142.1 hypothetical protein [Streptomyces katrae]
MKLYVRLHRTCRQGKRKQMSRIDQCGTTVYRANPYNRLRLTRFAVAAVVLAAGALACDNSAGDSPAAKPSLSSPPSSWPGQGDPTTEAFRSHLTKDLATKALLSIAMHVLIEEPGPPVVARIITNLDPELRDADSPDVAKAEKVAKAFANWRSDTFKDHGTVRVTNPATETMTTLNW